MRLKITSALDVRDGYGYIGQELSLALAQFGHEVWLDPIRGWYSEEQQKPELRKLRKPINNVDFELIIYYPGVIKTNNACGILTMYEANKLPSLWTHLLNAYPNVFGPSQFVTEVFKNSGVNNVKLLPLGIDSKFYSFKERIVEDTFTFFSLGKMEPRKNAEVLVEAFMKVFGGRKDVRLVIKTRERFLPHNIRISSLPNVSVIEKTITEKELLELYYQAHCFVYPSRGEGFSFPPRNALATGLPTIVTGWSALNEIKGAIKIPVTTLSPMPPCGFSYGEEQNLLMADIDPDILAQKLLDVYNDYYGARDSMLKAHNELSWNEAAVLATDIIGGLI